MRTIASLVAILALLASGLPVGAAPSQKGAQSLPAGLGSYADPFWGTKEGYVCRRWCYTDRTPCDPVRYKAADGRCFGEIRTFFGVLNCKIVGETRPECPTSRSGR